MHERESVFNFAVTMNYCIETIPLFIRKEIDLPASKSISNRALIINALSGGKCELRNVARCDDTDAVVAALSNHDGYINIGAAGTAMRFLTAYFSLQARRTVTLDGSERMRNRPIKPLVDALNACGADIRYVGKEGFPPLEIHGLSYSSESIEIDAGMSSQYISAVLMTAPAIGCRQIVLKGDITSRPYIDMTLGVMRNFGIRSQFTGNIITIEAGGYIPPSSFVVENDWTAASYWFAMQALLQESRISLKGLFGNSLQGDARVCDLYECFGVQSCGCGTYIDLRNAANFAADEECRVMDLSDNPDLAQTIVVTACLLNKPFHITGLHTLRIKETDRLEALRSQLLKLGYVLKVGEDCSLLWDGETVQAEPHPVIETYDDHRMAMAFATAAIRFPGLVIADAGVVSKSYPDFWKHFAACGFGLKEVEI